MWMQLNSVILVIAALATPVVGGEGGTPLETSSVGARETDSGGFALIEHNFWPAPRPTAGAVPTLDPILRSVRPGLRKRNVYLTQIYGAEVRHSLPPGLLDALVWAESGYDPLAVSPVGAVGLTQLMPRTAKDLGIANRYDPFASIEGGARYLRQMLDRFGSIHLAVAAYNAGPGAVRRAGGIPLNGETPGYVARVMRRWIESDRTRD